MTERSTDDTNLPSPLTPVVRGGLTDRVIEQLRERIADGTWTLHQRLPTESALATELGVGRSTIREAVRVLVHTGLLEVRQGNGTFVRSRRDIDAALHKRVLSADPLDAFEVRRGLEIEVARLAAQHRSEADLACLRDLAKQREEAYDTNWAAYPKADVALREQILETTRNPLLADLYRATVNALHTAIAQYFDDAELAHDHPDQPETPELLQAIEDRDPEAAAAVAQRHMNNTLRVLQLVLQAVVAKHPPPDDPPDA
jgi:DNA-binding FadR family transcriptional regulator